MARILLVEDNAMNLDMLTRRLVRRGFEVLVARTGLEAVQVACAGLPDLVLMDLDLPEIDGWEATRRIRADHRAGKTPVIALTAHAMCGDRETAMAAGCDEYETKPIVWEQLLAKISRLLPAPSGPPEACRLAPSPVQCSGMVRLK